MQQTNDNFQLNAPKALDAKYLTISNAPYTDVAAANAAIVSAYRSLGLSVLIGDGTNNSEYWYKDGLEDENLVQKTPPTWQQTLLSPNGSLLTTDNEVNADGHEFAMTGASSIAFGFSDPNSGKSGSLGTFSGGSTMRFFGPTDAGSIACFDDQITITSYNQTDQDNHQSQIALFATGEIDITNTQLLNIESGSINVNGRPLLEGVRHQVTISGTDGVFTYTVNHPLGSIPSQIFLTARSVDAAGGSVWLTNFTSTTFDIKYNGAPPSGTNNIIFDALILK